MRLETALTDLAIDLLQKMGAGRRPKEAVLRRAVSSACGFVVIVMARTLRHPT